MATSPLFGWEEPDDVDLVKDGAAAIRTLGNAIDTSMGDLLGGTSGQVLSKNSNTNMDFTWVTPDDANAIQNAIVDAKGDLIAASAADTPARLAVGNNGETLVADSSASVGLRYSATPSASNPVLNSAMQVWQRGTSFTISGLTNYTADRWQAYTGAAGMTVTRQTTSDTTNLPNIQYCLRAARDSGNSGTAARSVFQSFESVNSIPFAGKTVTVSFYARKGANFTPTTFLFQLISGTGTDQNIILGYTGQTDVISQSTTPTTTWARYSYTGTVPTNCTELAPYFSWSPTGTAGAADFLELTGVQIDVGSVALPYRTNSGTIQGELAACQRYYQKSYDQSVTPGTSGSVGPLAPNATAAVATSNQFHSTVFPVTMRTAPTVTIYGWSGGVTKVADGGGTDLAANSGTATNPGMNGFRMVNTSGGNITPSFGGFLYHYVASAEL
jgi:hypothetical protein